jgi:hypothetical protein
METEGAQSGGKAPSQWLLTTPLRLAMLHCPVRMKTSLLDGGRLARTARRSGRISIFFSFERERERREERFEGLLVWFLKGTMVD